MLCVAPWEMDVDSAASDERANTGLRLNRLGGTDVDVNACPHGDRRSILPDAPQMNYGIGRAIPHRSASLATNQCVALTSPSVFAYRTPEAQWPALQETIIRDMDRLEKALRPYLKQLKLNA